jgi:hypothetical protein
MEEIDFEQSHPVFRYLVFEVVGLSTTQSLYGVINYLSSLKDVYGYTSPVLKKGSRFLRRSKEHPFATVKEILRELGIKIPKFEYTKKRIEWNAKHETVSEEEIANYVPSEEE